MKKSYAVSLIVFVVLLLVMINAYLYHQHVQDMHFSCQGTSLVVNDGYTLQARVSVFYSGDVGEVLIEGVVRNKDVYVGTVHRMVDFHFKNNGNDYYTTNYSVTELPNNTLNESLMKMLFPPYIFNNGLMSKVRVVKVAGWGYLIKREKYIHLYCIK